MRRPNWIRWGVRGALTLGVAASIAANVLHAEPTIKARVISAWAPVALLVTIELIARVPTRRAWLVRGRLAAAAVVAVVAAYASYWHMAAVAARYGEEAITAHILPLSVDGLIVVASICLVELGGQGVAAATDHTPAAAADPVPTPPHPGAGVAGVDDLTEPPDDGPEDDADDGPVASPDPLIQAIKELVGSGEVPPFEDLAPMLRDRDWRFKNDRARRARTAVLAERNGALTSGTPS